MAVLRNILRLSILTLQSTVKGETTKKQWEILYSNRRNRPKQTQGISILYSNRPEKQNIYNLFTTQNCLLCSLVWLEIFFIRQKSIWYHTLQNKSSMNLLSTPPHPTYLLGIVMLSQQVIQKRCPQLGLALVSGQQTNGMVTV